MSEPDKPEVYCSDGRIHIEQSSNGTASKVSVRPEEVNGLIERLQDCLHESGYESREGLINQTTDCEDYIGQKSLEEVRADVAARDSAHNAKYHTQIIKLPTS